MEIKYKTYERVKGNGKRLRARLISKQEQARDQARNQARD